MEREHKCSGFGKICNKKATMQTAKGKDAEESGALEQNWGYYCADCYREGLDMENEAMYG